MSTSKSDARINVRLSSDLKQTIEEAAVALGQTVSEFTISTVVREARQVLQDAQMTQLSNRDRDAFLAALDDTSAKPNEALKAAARRFKKRAV
ncbi:MAG: type II toxin-antitoxin system TacA family antitoxin [Pirellulales bacterium]